MALVARIDCSSFRERDGLLFHRAREISLFTSVIYPKSL
jgi:hypothetical protein